MASIKRRPDGRWRAGYRDDQDREHSRHFDRKIDGETWLAEQTVAVATGAHVVPRLSRITVQTFYDDWSRRQVWASGARTAMDLAMRSSRLGGYQLGQVGHSHIEAWIKRMVDQPLARGTIKTDTTTCAASSARPSAIGSSCVTPPRRFGSPASVAPTPA